MIFFWEREVAEKPRNSLNTKKSDTPSSLARLPLNLEIFHMKSMSTCLWFNNQAQEAANFYVNIVPNSRIVDTKYYMEGAPLPAGTVLTVQFTLNGSDYLALNGGPIFQFSPAISLILNCDTQEEIDVFWRKLSEGGQESQCGWLTDRYGLSWQIVPTILPKLLNTADSAASQRAFSALMKMTKLDIAQLQRAYDHS
jgi:predicted 3-demethylubiquinone-9 3-methyltransferase (glyoxalase superfamily)